VIQKLKVSLFAHPNLLNRLQMMGFLLGFIIVSVSTLSPADQLPSVSGSDKLHHVIGFGSWVLLCCLGSRKRLFKMSAFIFVWGGLIEIIQPWVNRYGEWQDFAANSVGIGLALVCIVLFRRHVISKMT